MSGGMKTELAELSDVDFETWLDNQGFSADGEPRWMFQAMRQSMLESLAQLNTAIQQAETAVTSAQKARETAQASSPPSLPGGPRFGSGTPRRDAQPQASWPNPHFLIPRVLTWEPIRSDFASTGSGILR